jgi:hypothetical protein
MFYSIPLRLTDDTNLSGVYLRDGRQITERREIAWSSKILSVSWLGGGNVAVWCCTKTKTRRAANSGKLIPFHIGSPFYGWDENTFITFRENKNLYKSCHSFRKISSIFRECFCKKFSQKPQSDEKRYKISVEKVYMEPYIGLLDPDPYIISTDPDSDLVPDLGLI